jgi:RimJ/RimL family protein N-acetyltransferase
MMRPSCRPIEVGWRFHQRFWGNGFTFEAATPAINYAFELLQWKRIVAFTTYQNGPSWRLILRLEMVSEKQDDFIQPPVPDGHPLAPHCLYRLAIAPELITR